MSGKLHILFLTHYFPPEGNAPASRVHAMCKRWVAAGHRVTVITCAPNVPDGVVYEGYRNRLSQRETMDGIEVIRIWTFMAANRGTFKRIINYCSYLIAATTRSIFVRRPDVVIATSPQFFCGVAGVFASWIKRASFVLEIRDIWPASILAVGALGATEAKPSSMLIRMLERLERWLYRRAKHLVTVGEGYRDELRERGVPTEKISIITNGVNTEIFRPREPKPDLRREIGLEADHFVVSYIGTVGMASGLEVVLRAATKIRESDAPGMDRVRFVIVGDGATRADLEQKAEEQGLSNVLFVGRRAKQEMPDFLAMTDVGLVHLAKRRLFETVLPSKIFETAAMKRPIILGVGGDAKELVERSGAGLCIEPENHDELLHAINQLMSDRKLYDRLAESGHEFFVRDYNVDALADRYFEIIGRVAGRLLPMKRIMDVVLACVALLLLAIPFTIIIVVLKVTGERQAWFLQERVGRFKRVFKVFKFITMRTGAEATGTKDITVRDDPRVLPVGRFLRKTKLNELPQFINVLLGDMSLVGWRPLMPVSFSLYEPELQEGIVKAKPGLTGLGSIVFRDEEKIVSEAGEQGKDLRRVYKEDIMPYKGRLETWYAEHQGVWLDFKILLATGFAVFLPGSSFYRSWFRSLPEPESPLVRKHLGFSAMRDAADSGEPTAQSAAK